MGVTEPGAPADPVTALLQKHEEENSKLEEALKKMQESDETSRVNEQQRNFEKTIAMLSAKVGQLYGNDSNKNGGNGPVSGSGHSGPGSLTNGSGPSGAMLESTVGQFAIEMTKQAEQLPENSELRRLTNQHIRKMVLLRMEQESVAQLKEIDRLRIESKQQQEDEKRRIAYLQWKEEMRKKEANAKLLTLSHMANPNSVGVDPKTVFVRAEGFSICWDFVVGMSKKVKATSIVYQLMEGRVGRDSVKSTPFKACTLEKIDGKKINHAIIGIKKAFHKVPASTRLRFLIEVQKQKAKGEKGKTESIGWTVVELFNGKSFARGHMRVPLFKAPLNPKLSIEDVKAKHKPTKADLYIKILTAAEAEDHEAGGDPDGVLSSYRIPRYYRGIREDEEEGDDEDGQENHAFATDETKRAVEEVRNSSLDLEDIAAAAASHLRRSGDESESDRADTRATNSARSNQSRTSSKAASARNKKDGDDARETSDKNGADDHSSGHDEDEAEETHRESEAEEEEKVVEEVEQPEETPTTERNDDEEKQLLVEEEEKEEKEGKVQPQDENNEAAEEPEAAVEPEPVEPVPPPIPQADLSRYDAHKGVGVAIEKLSLETLSMNEYSRVRVSIFDGPSIAMSQPEEDEDSEGDSDDEDASSSSSSSSSDDEEDSSRRRKKGKAKKPQQKKQKNKKKRPRARGDNPGSPLVWTSSYAQAGVCGELGVTQWFQKNVFSDLAYSPNAYIVVEVLSSNKRPKSDSDVSLYEEKENLMGWSAIPIFVIDEDGKTVPGFEYGEVPLYPAPFIPELLQGYLPPALHSKNEVVLHIFDPKYPPSLRKVSLLAKSRKKGSELAWIPVQHKSRKKKQFAPGGGFDVYVDSARFLPQCTTISRVTVDLYTSGGKIEEASVAPKKKKGEHSEEGEEDEEDEEEEVEEEMEMPNWEFSDPNGKTFSPTYEMRKEYRGASFDPTSTLVIRVDTIDRKTKRYRVVGTTVLNIFVDLETGGAAANPECASYALNDGGFQIPLYFGTIPIDGNVFADTYSTRKPRVPCASLLVRIVPAVQSADKRTVLSTATVPESQWTQLGLVRPPKSDGYMSGEYDTSRCIPTSVEQTIYNRLSKSADRTVRESLMEIVSEDDEEEHAKLSTQDGIEKVMYSKLNLPPTIPLGKLKSMDVDRFAEYDPNCGFRFSVDGVHNVHQVKGESLTGGSGPLTGGRGFTGVVFSLSPPGGFYQEVPLNHEVGYTQTLALDSTVRTPRFVDAPMLFRHIAFDPYAVAIVDVRETLFENGTFTKPRCIGWGVVPLFTPDGYVYSGSHQIPLFDGKVPPNIVTRMQHEYAMDVLQDEVKKKRIKPSEWSTAFIRLIDEQRSFMVPPPMNDESNKLFLKVHPKIASQLQKGSLSRDEAGQYEFDPVKATKGTLFGGRPKSVESIVPKGYHPADFMYSLSESFRVSLGLL